jgi:hypothetical protein
MAIEDNELLAEFDSDPVSMGYKTSPVEGDGYKTTKELSQLLGGRRLITNPTNVGQVLKPVTISDLLTLVPSSERATLSQGTVTRIRELIQTNDITGLSLVMQWLNDRSDAGMSEDILSDETFATLADRLVEKHNDPDYATQVYDPVTPRVTVLWNQNTDREQINRILERS